MARQQVSGGPNFKSASPCMTVTSNLTIACWYYTTGTDSTFFFNGNVSNNGYGIEANAAGNSGHVTVLVGNGTSLITLTSTVTPSSNVWHHYALSNTGSTTWKFYLDGAAQTLTPSTQAATTPTSFSFLGLTTTSTRGADVGMWNTNLTDFEVLSLANGARPGSIRPSNLKLWWPLDGLQSPEPDLSGNGLNGTITGTTTIGFGPPFMPFTPLWPQANNAIIPVIAAFKPQFALGKNIVVEGVAT